jgi:hypothetical protein
MAEQHTRTRDVFGRIRNKIATRFSHPHSPRPSGTSHPTTRPRGQSFHNLPSAPNPPSQNPFPISNFPGLDISSHPPSTIVSDNTNFVGHDQFNVTLTHVSNVTNVPANPGLRTGKPPNQ